MIPLRNDYINKARTIAIFMDMLTWNGKFWGSIHKQKKLQATIDSGEKEN